MNHEEKTLLYLVRNITRMGNTCLRENPKKYVEGLRCAGIEIRWKKVELTDAEGYVRKERKHFTYIIERTNK